MQDRERWPVYFVFFSQVDELRGKLEEKNKTIEKKTAAALHATQEKNRITNELSDLRDQIDIKDRKVNVLQRKVRSPPNCNNAEKCFFNNHNGSLFCSHITYTNIFAEARTLHTINFALYIVQGVLSLKWSHDFLNDNLQWL